MATAPSAGSEASAAAGSYLAGGRRHEVRVRRDHVGRWQVIDAGPELLILVETLTGHDDRRPQACALARDFAEQRSAFLRGERDSDPLPRLEPRTS